MSYKGLPNVAPEFVVEEATGTRVRPEAPSEHRLQSACTYARRLLDAGRAADAMQILETELEEGKQHAEFQFLLGRAAFRLGRHVQAHRAFSRAVSLSPQDAEVYRWLTRLLMRRDNALGAMRALEWTSRLTAPAGQDNDPSDHPSPFEGEPETQPLAQPVPAAEPQTAQTSKGKPGRSAR